MCPHVSISVLFVNYSGIYVMLIMLRTVSNHSILYIDEVMDRVLIIKNESLAMKTGINTCENSVVPDWPLKSAFMKLFVKMNRLLNENPLCLNRKLANWLK